jgi:hypothetical protein
MMVGIALLLPMPETGVIGKRGPGHITSRLAGWPLLLDRSGRKNPLVGAYFGHAATFLRGFAE